MHMMGFPGGVREMFDSPEKLSGAVAASNRECKNLGSLKVLSSD